MRIRETRGNPICAKIPPLPAVERSALAVAGSLALNHRVPTRIIAVANQKGGVGKTTTSVNVAACVAAAGHRVLLLDLDPQANATSGLGVEKTEGASIYGALLGESTVADKVISTGFENLDLIPSEMDLCGADIEIARMDDHLERVKKAIEPIRAEGTYDVIFIDCPPSLGVLTLNAFAASEGVLVPLQCEYYALEGMAMMQRIVEQLRDGGVNGELGFLGIVMTMFDSRTNLSNLVVSEVREHYGEFVFETVIPRTTRLAEAPSHGQPIIYYDKYSAGAAAYEVLSEEIRQRLGYVESPAVDE